jgi:hypothetical protein
MHGVNKDVQAELQQIVGPNVEVKPDPAYIGFPTPSPLRPDVLAAVTKAVQHFHGTAMRVYPVMSTGASDGSFFRAQGSVYDVDGSWGISPDDERAHGLDEHAGTFDVRRRSALGDDHQGVGGLGFPSPHSTRLRRASGP